MIILVSALLSWSAIAVTQSWLSYHRCDRTRYLWVGLSILSLIIATIGAIVIGILAIFVFRPETQLSPASSGSLISDAKLLVQ